MCGSETRWYPRVFAFLIRPTRPVQAKWPASMVPSHVLAIPSLASIVGLLTCYRDATSRLLRVVDAANDVEPTVAKNVTGGGVSSL